MKNLVVVIIGMLFSTALYAQGEFTIYIEDLKNDDGQLVILLFNNGDEFGIDAEPFRKITFDNMSNNKAAFTISEVEEGEYAFLIYHDENMDGECETSWFGMPKEGVGKSGESGSRPTFNNSKFKFDGIKKIFNINLKYL